MATASRSTADDLLRELMLRAGEAAMRHFEHPQILGRKADDSLVSVADLAAEEILLAGLRAAWPDDTILSEERGLLPGKGPGRWLVDPIDGTSAFLEGLAHWGPAVARLVQDETGRERVERGAIWLPRLGEYYHVADNTSYYNGRPLPPIQPDSPSRTIYLPSRFHQHFNLEYRAKGRCLGGTAAHLALVARGAALAAIVAPGWSLWDTATGLRLIEGVGGAVLRLPEGTPFDPVADEGAPFLAGAREVVEEIAWKGLSFRG